MEEKEQRERIIHDMTKVRHILDKICVTKEHNEEKKQQQTMQSEGITIHITTTTSETFNITMDMM